MSNLFISGLLNIETTLAISGFPLPYAPVHYPFHGIQSTVSGVGFNLAKALHQLGNQVSLHSLLGQDMAADMIRHAVAEVGLSTQGLEASLCATAQSVILYEPDGRRQIHVDLKECQERQLSQVTDTQLQQADLALLCNINFSRPLLQRAKKLGTPIACDVHVLSDPFDAYNRDFMQAADILFLSDEGLGDRPAEALLRELAALYGSAIVVMGQGQAGALMYVRADQQVYHAPACAPRGIINTVGAGDALFSAFIHDWSKHRNPYQALTRATYYAGWKIGSTGAAEGLLDEAQWLALCP
ncbi:MAG: carbohydrate kinase family protein [Aeromonadaceae bacterium]